MGKVGDVWIQNFSHSEDRRSHENNIKMDLKEIECEDVDYLHVIYDSG
jgi:hypothetical protein